MDGLTPQQVGAPLLQAVQPQQPTPQEILAQIQERAAANIEAQKASAEATQGRIQELRNKKPGVNLVPFAMASDMLAGTKLAPQAMAMHQMQQRPQMEAARLEDMLRKQQGAITDDEINLLKAQYAQAKGGEGMSFADKQDMMLKNKKEVLKTQFDFNSQLKQMGLDASKQKAAQKAQEKASKPPEFKRDQSNAAGFGRRMEQANLIFDALEKKKYDRSGFMQSVSSTLVPRELQTENLRAQEQAERNFVNAALRRESGAAIAPHEFSSAEQQYFPRPGDTPDILAHKRANRLQTLEALKVGAGPAWEATPLINPLTGKKETGKTQAPDFDNMSDAELQQYLGQ